MTSKHNFFFKSASNLSEIPDNSVHLVVTSPPYPMIEMWDDCFKRQDPSIDILNPMCAFEKMHCILDTVWKECNRVLVDGGFICINIGDAVRTIDGKFQLYSNHSRIISTFSEMGFLVLPDIHWRKPSNAPNKFLGSGMYPAGAYVTYEHEYILIFKKGGKRKFTPEEIILRRQSAYFWEERNVWFSDLWEVNGERQKLQINGVRDRSASFPFEIPYRLINMYSIKGDIVLDPFGGTGTTPLACAASERNSIFYEYDKNFKQIFMDKLQNSIRNVNKYIENRLNNHILWCDKLDETSKSKLYKNENLHTFVKTKQEIYLKLSKIDEIFVNNDTVEVSYSNIS